jgi:triosephosphate isomerase (TIM)
VIAPVFTALKPVADRLEGSNIHVSAQDCAPVAAEGAQTGEVAAFMLRDVGCSYVILGHSERRQFYGETDQLIAQKVQAALGAGVQVILCVGESLEQRNRGIEVQVVAGQLRGCLSGLTASDLDRIIVAYEPIWAIGTGIAATPEQAQEMHGLIRRAFAEKISEKAAVQLRILYGGSVKPDNIRSLMNGSDVDGVLVGGASLSAESFAEIVNYNR